MREFAWVIWGIVGIAILLAGLILLLLHAGSESGYRCGYRDAKEGRLPEHALFQDETCSVREWERSR